MLKTSRGKITLLVLLFVLLLIIGGFLFFIKDNKKQGINNTLFSYFGTVDVVIYNFFRLS